MAKTEFRSWLSNGCLMRITPLAVWAADVEDLEVHQALIKADTELTHSNVLAQETCFVYCQTIAVLIKYAHDPEKVTKACGHAAQIAMNMATSQI